jgi:hypothetical protein
MQALNNHKLPPVGVSVSVIHEGRYRRAYLDGDRKWRDETNGDLLRGEVIAIESDLGLLISALRVR